MHPSLSCLKRLQDTKANIRIDFELRDEERVGMPVECTTMTSDGDVKEAMAIDRRRLNESEVMKYLARGISSALGDAGSWRKAE